MTRRFVANSISEFDTDDGTTDETQGRKINKLLTIYGREFDEIKKYSDGIKFANVVTYNKRDNTPDELIKNLARTMGFETIKSVSDNKLLSYIAKSNQAVFSGESRSMSIQEIDTELWRRLVINAWWLYKSKGSRKVIEFFIKLFGLGECLINFDECVYVVDNKLDVEETFAQVEEIMSIGLPSGTTVTVDRDDYPIDEQGFPRTLPNTQDYYFQMNGFWYNGGTQRTTGNNPHYGPYDYGSKYFEKFSCFIDDFSGRTETTLQPYTEYLNLFNDYNHGEFEVTLEDGRPLMDYGDTYAQIMTKDNRVSEMTHLLGAGFSTDKSRTGLGSLKLTFTCGDEDCSVPCPNFILDKETGLVLTQPTDPTIPATEPLSAECCVYHGFDYVPTQFSELYKSTLSVENLALTLEYESLIKEKYQGNIGTTSCFWCLPAIPVCDFTAYINILIRLQGIQGLIEVLINEGLLDPNSTNQFIEQWNQNQSELTTKVISWFDKRYSGYCLVIHDNFEEVSEECCKIRGGNWVDLNGQNDGITSPEWKCLIPKDVPCPTLPELTLEDLEFNGTTYTHYTFGLPTIPISSECCLSLGLGTPTTLSNGVTICVESMVEPCPTTDEINIEIYQAITFFTNVTERCCTREVIEPIAGTTPIWGDPYGDGRVGCWVDFQVQTGGNGLDDAAYTPSTSVDLVTTTLT
jgi:hypothetical protein